MVDSGRLVFEGNVTSDNKGFEVAFSQPRDGCRVSAGLVYEEAEGDSDFAVGLALISRCGNAECVATYAGAANKR